jgi:glutamine synthetase
MLVVPDAATAKMDPFYEAPTLVLICDIVDPVTREAYSRDPRNITKKADAYLKSSGIGDVAYIGPEAEFFIFDDIRFESTRFSAFYEIDSVEGSWNTGRDEGPNLGYKPRPKEGAPIWATNRATKKATFRFHPWTNSRICAPRWS